MLPLPADTFNENMILALSTRLTEFRRMSDQSLSSSQRSIGSSHSDVPPTDSVSPTTDFVSARTVTDSTRASSASVPDEKPLPIEQRVESQVPSVKTLQQNYATLRENFRGAAGGASKGKRGFVSEESNTVYDRPEDAMLGYDIVTDSVAYGSPSRSLETDYD